MTTWTCKSCEEIFEIKSNCIVHTMVNKHSDFTNELQDKMNIVSEIDPAHTKFLAVY